MAFDADQYHATVSPPWQFTAGGRTYVAQHVSMPEVERYLEATNEVGMESPADVRKRSAALYRLLRQAYPRKLSFWWRRHEDPVWVFLHLPPRTRKAALEDFFGILGIVVQTTPQTTTTPSTPSVEAPTSTTSGGDASAT